MVWLDARQMRELGRLRIEAMQPGLQSRDEAAAAHRRQKPHLLRGRPGAQLTARRMPAVRASPLDVEEPHCRVALDPYRPLAELGAYLADVSRLHDESIASVSIVRVDHAQ